MVNDEFHEVADEIHVEVRGPFRHNVPYKLPIVGEEGVIVGVIVTKEEISCICESLSAGVVQAVAGAAIVARREVLEEFLSHGVGQSAEAIGERISDAIDLILELVIPVILSDLLDLFEKQVRHKVPRSGSLVITTMDDKMLDNSG